MGLPDPDLLAALDAVDLERLAARPSAKWTAYPPGVIPAFIAEMDFPLAEPIRTRLHAMIDAGELGYAAPNRSPVRAALAAWLGRHYAWHPDPEAIVVLPDAVRAIELAVLAHSEPGDAIVVPTPVYPPFLTSVTAHSRRLVEVELQRRGDSFGQDFAGIERALGRGARMILFCHPHNPTGHLHARADLETLAELAAAHGAIVVSDEIHAPLTLDGHGHLPLVMVSPKDTITITSASKAWNIPGLKTAFLIAEPQHLLDPILALPPRMRTGASIMGLQASIAAFESGGGWLEALLGVLERNRATVLDAVASMPEGIRASVPRATYLAWLDCRALELPGSPYEFFLEHARVALSDGAQFGLGGAGHVRLNFGTSAGVLEQILTRMDRALRRR